MRATASPSPFGGESAVAILEVDLGMSWPADTARDVVLLGDLPVDRCMMVLGDASALDVFVGISGGTTDGLADVAYWGLHEDEAHAVFGGEVLTCRAARVAGLTCRPGRPGNLAPRSRAGQTSTSRAPA